MSAPVAITGAIAARCLPFEWLWRELGRCADIFKTFVCRIKIMPESSHSAVTAAANTESQSSNHVLWIVMAFGLLIRLVYFVGVSGWDDVDYFRYAVEASEGQFSTEFEDNGSFPFRFRVGLIWPTAFLFRVFGVSEYTAAVLPLGVSLGNIYLCWLVGQRLSRRCGVYAALLMATFPLSIVQATTLQPGPFAAFFTGVSIFLFLKLNRVDSSPTSRVASFGGGLLLGAAYFYRIEAGLFVMFYLGFALYRRTAWQSCLWALTGAASVVAIETFVYLALHGEFLYRLKAISGGFSETKSELSAAILAEKSPLVYARLIFLKPVDLGLHWAFAVLAVIYSTVTVRLRRMPLLIWFWPVMLYLLFGSWSLSSYVPTTKNSRYLLIVTVPAFVLLANVCADWHRRRGWRRFVASSGLVAIVAGSLAVTNVAFVYRLENANGARHAAQLLRRTPNHLRPSQIVWSDHHGALAMAALLPESDVRALNFHDVSDSADVQLQDLSDLNEGFVFADRFTLHKYAEYAGMRIPKYVTSPPAHWTEIMTQPHPKSHFAYDVCKAIDRLAGGRLGGLRTSLQDAPFSIWQICTPDVR